MQKSTGPGEVVWKWGASMDWKIIEVLCCKYWQKYEMKFLCSPYGNFQVLQKHAISFSCFFVGNLEICWKYLWFTSVTNLFLQYSAQHACGIWNLVERECKEQGLEVSLTSNEPCKIQYRGKAAAVKEARKILAKLNKVRICYLKLCATLSMVRERNFSYWVVIVFLTWMWSKPFFSCF